MKKKYTEDDSENEFSVDEPEELEESDDDWTPAASEGRGRRPRRGRAPVSAKKPRLSEPHSSEEEEEEDEEDVEDEEEEDEEEEESAPEAEAEAEEANEDKGKKKRGRVSTTSGRGGRGRGKKSASTTSPSVTKEKDSDVTSTVAENALPTPVEKEFTSGAFVVLKVDFQNQKDPPIWKIDGKALLQKYIPFEQDGNTLYRNTSTYSGWSTVLKDRYYPAQIAFKMQNRKETVVEFLRDKIKVEDSE